MTRLRPLTVFLLVFSQFSLAFQTRPEFVFCVKDSGTFAVESSINGTCEDSAKWFLNNHGLRFFDNNQRPYSENCKDYSLAKMLFNPENGGKDLALKTLYSPWFLKIQSVSSLQLNVSDRYTNTALYMGTTALDLRKTVVLLL